MAKITREVAKIFGSTAGVNQIGQFGSLAAGSPAYSTDPGTIQNLSQWLSGWFEAVIGANSPAIEDMNAFCYVVAYQIAYLMQTGVAEWNSETTYYIGSLANDGLGNTFVSITDDNLNNALTDGANWVSTRFTKRTADASLNIPANYNLNLGFATIPDTVTYTVAGTICCGGSIIVTGTGSLIVTGSGIVYIN